MTSGIADDPAWLLEYATRAGANAPLLFLIILGVLMVLVILGWQVAKNHVLPLARQRVPQPAMVLLNGLIGFAVIIGAALLFAEIAEALTDGDAMSRIDEALTASISENVGTATLRAFWVFTHFGDSLTLAVLGFTVGVALWFTRRRALALAWVLAVGGNALLNPALKGVFERVRPLHENGLVSELGWSFPSGHTSGATVAYGMLAYIAVRSLPAVWHLPAVLTAVALAFTVGCSRIFLRVHFASDVAAGFASGAAWLTACIISVELSRRYNVRVRSTD